MSERTGSDAAVSGTEITACAVPQIPRKTERCECPYQKENDACHPECLMYKALVKDEV